MRVLAMGILLLSLSYGAAGAWAYPLDGCPVTGILRLEDTGLPQGGTVRGPAATQRGHAHPGITSICVFPNGKDLVLPASDPAFVAQLKSYWEKKPTATGSPCWTFRTWNARDTASSTGITVLIQAASGN